jgi:hypothetical protein
MAKTLTLEEAAQQLGLTVEQFKTNLKTHKDFKSVRPLMGGATMHFREQDIEELSRKLGLGSEPELQLGDAGSDPGVSSGLGASDQIEIGRDPPRPGSSPRLQSPSGKRVKADDSSEDFIPISGDSGKKKDSDVKVPRDSGARIESRGAPPPGTPTDEIDLEAEARKGGKSEVFKLAADSGSKTGKSSTGKSAPKTGSKSDPKKQKPGSEFELQLGTDSDSEFELTLADDSDEVQLGSSPRDVSGASGKSGVRLNKPIDSGISLEKKGGDEDESDFELNLDSASAHKVAGGPRSSKKTKKDSESEFELSLDDSSGEVAPLSSEEGKDIFATDFDIPALDDSGSEAVVLENSDTALESSDFDLEDSAAIDADESASEVVQLDDDMTEGAGRSSKRRRGGDDDVSAEEALADIDEEEEEDEEVEAAPAAVAAPARWGPLPALVLFPCLFIMMIVMFMGFELLHGMWSYRSGASKPTYTITRGIAGMFKDANELPKD